jgi:nitrate/nitrite-specific signal transduction histidine kinase
VILDVGREGIRNAFLHADATEIHVVIAYSGRMLCLMILDDGHGIDEEVVRKRQGEGHWGIVGQRERAKLLSAHLMIQRRELRGTRVSLEVPARIAYKNTRANVLKRLGER